MKKILSLFAIVAMITLTACGAAQEPAPITPEDQIQNEIDELPEEIEGEEIEDIQLPEDEETIPDEILEDMILDLDDEEIPEEEESTHDEQSYDYIGTWSRIGGTIDGVPKDLVPATIIMTEDKYTSSTDLCTISGDMAVVDDMMDIYIKTSDCPGEVLPNYVNTFEVSEDGETLTTTNTQFGATMVETYSRVE